jgi:hypothetical protein
MFVQLIQGRVEDAAALKTMVDQWQRELAPGASGWLGSTGGVTEDGTAITMVRFESEAAARANSERLEQDAWWTQASKLFLGEPTFRESSMVTLDTPGDPAKAGFVQFMQGRGRDPERARELMSQDSTERAAFRPDVLGSVTAEFEDGEFTMAIYFTSEAAAREAEKKEPPPEMKAAMEELMSLSIGELSFFDLKSPWMHAPA